MARGLLDNFLGASLSARVGVGDIIPGTGVLRRGGYNTFMTDMTGPVGGFATAASKSSSEAMKGNAMRMFREAPVTAVKNITETFVYLNNGNILNKRGQIVATDPTYGETFARFIGLYPDRQVSSNEYIRHAKISIDYNKEIKGTFVSRYVAAKIDGDNKRARRIQKEVAEWNRDAKGTTLQITGFGQAANRAYMAARRPQYKTFERSAPVNMRREQKRLRTLYGLD